MTEGPGKSTETDVFDAKARAEQIRRAAQAHEPEQKRGFLGSLSGGDILGLVLIGFLAMVMLATLVLGLPLSMVGGKVALVLPIILLCVFLLRNRRGGTF